MSLQLELFLLCEGATSDARGLLALVGVGQNVIVPNALPITATRTVALLVHEENAESGTLAPGVGVDVEVQVFTPEGNLAGSLFESLEAGDKGYPQAPSGVGLVGQLKFKISESGRYRVKLNLSTTADDELEANRFIYVAGPPGEGAPEARS